MNFPSPSTLPWTDSEIPYLILGDEAFPLLLNLMKPYPRSQSSTDMSKAIYNYRLSRARRVVENAFGILTQTFRIFHTPICLSLDVVDNLITSACIIHNIRIDSNTTISKQSDEELHALPSNNFFSIGNQDEPLLENTDQIEPIDENGNILTPRDVRDKLREYFNSIGAVPWQTNAFFQ